MREWLRLVIDSHHRTDHAYDRGMDWTRGYPGTGFEGSHFMDMLRRVILKGYKSIQEMDLEFHR